ncbi:permease YjgP/YjgQ family protein [Denitrovibrio acetiphilus DSM 12809]|uniref:Permease YjgP/YjgQ family protein n=1 Tax=Denitrovibrio acetiphilus (strain DSM 12809 / NBRC 114555 / N2460) TaxID=522772 RepID=D4H8C4_DENA2|nr:LptF/LptG family permease [Denitrovibrio acetiphilus]ADD68273.1 permease YjgP/YjgQ family protein [Denitrovibrio acetiphilus DSM 12809]
MKLLHKYILKEIYPIFFLGNVFFVLLLLLDKLIDLADLFFTKNVPAFLIIQTIVYYLPSFLVITIPTSAMLAVMIGFGRLSSDSEVTAMRAAGAGKKFFTTPTIIFGLTAFLLGIMMSLWLMPAGSRNAIGNLSKIAKLVSINDMKEKELYDELPGIVFYAVKKDSNAKYRKMVIIDKAQHSVITANEAEILPSGNAGLLMNLKNGRIVTLNEDGKHSKINFDTFTLNSPLIDAKDISVNSERIMQTKDLIENFQEAPLYKFEFSKRISMPFAAIIMSIFGMSLGIFFHRSGRSLAIPITIAVVAVYNILFFAAENFAESGRIEPFLAAWLPNILFALIAVFFYRRAMK